MSAKAKTPRRKAVRKTSSPTLSGQAKKAARAKARPKQAKKAPRKPARPRARAGGPEERLLQGEELSSADVRLQQLLKFNPAIIYACEASEDYLLKSISENVVSVLGYTAKECLADPEFFDKLLHPDDIDRVLSKLPSLVKKGHVVLEYRFLHKDGTYRWMHDESKLSYDAKGKPHELVGYWIDITERRKAEEVLRETKSQLRLMLDQLPAIAWTADRELRITSTLGAGLAIVNHKPDQVVGTTMYEHVGTDDPENAVIAAHLRALKGERARYPYEFMGRAYDSVVEPFKDADGNIVGCIGIAYDITERKRAEEELASAKSRLEFLLGSSPAIIYSSEASGNFLLKSISENIFSILGYTAEECLADPAFSDDSYVHPDDKERLKLEFQDALVKGHGTCDYRFLHKDGTYRWMRDEFKLVRDADGNPYEFIGYGIDITERKRAEEQLISTKSRLEYLLGSSPAIIYTCEAYGDFLLKSVSENVLSVLGYTPEECLTDPEFFEDRYAHPDDQERIDSDFRDAVAKGHGASEYRFLHKDGTYRWMREEFKLVRDADGNPYEFVGYWTDITERKRAEEESASAKSRLEYLLGSSPAIIYSYETSGDNRMKTISENVFSVLGYTAEECLADSAFSDDTYVHPDNKEQVDSEFQDAIAKGHGVTEYRFLHKNGTYRWMHEEFKLVRDADGNPYEFVGYVIDITERKRAEEERERLLHHVEERYKELKCVYGVAESIRKRETLDEIFMDVAALIPPGWHYPEITRGKVRFEGREYVSEQFEETGWKQSSDIVVRGEKRGAVEVYYLEERPALDEGPFLKEERGLIDGIARTLAEVIERKRAEEELASAKAHLELLLGSSPAIIYSTEISGNFQLKFISENVYSILGYTAEECLADPEFAAYKYVHPDDKERVEREMQGAIAKGHGVGEYRFLHKDGTYRWIREEFKLVRDADGNPYEYVGYEIDITERKLAEEELISAKSRLEFLLRANPAVIYSAETSGDFRLKFISENVFSILGYTAEECLADPKLLDNTYVHPDDKERVRLEYQDATAKDHGTSEYRYMHKNGTYRWIREEFKLVRGADGNPLEFVGYWIDITQRKWAEEALVESEERFRSVFESSMIGMYRTTPDGRVLMANPAFARMLGYASVKEIAQHNLEKDGYWAEYERSLFVKRLEKEGQITGLEASWTRKDGTSLYVRESAIAVYDQAGHALYYEGTVEDITDRKRAEARLQDSEEKYHNLFRRSNYGIFIHDMDGNIMDVNRKALDQFGYSKSEILALRISDLHPPEAREASRRAFQKISRDGHANLEINFKRKNGEIFPAEVSSGFFEVAGQKVVQGVVRDITRRKRAEEALRDSEASFRLLFADNPHPMWVYDLETLRFLEVNDAAVEHYGYSRDEFLRMRVTDIRPPEEARRLLESMHEPRSPLRHGGQMKHRMKNSLLIDVEVVSHTLEFDGRKAALVVAQDVTERKQAEEQFVHNALHDSLTDLPNRMLLADRMEQMLARSKRRKDYSFAVLFLDLDRFKVVNDSLGHTVGDELLVGVARRLEKCLRAGDTVARVGGDEFTMLLDDIEGPSDATQAADRIQEELSPPFILSERQVFTTASIGIAFSTTGYDRSEDILRDADTAMYRAKELGRARYKVFDETMHTRAVDTFQLQTDLRRAVERNEFLIQYQPIVSLENGKLAGLEALLRWQHPQRGVIPPKEFIPIAEETGFINTIGLWVIQEAGRRLRAWQAQFPENASLFLSINISGKLFIQPDMVPQIGQILREIDLCPSNLRLEVTEGAVMENTEAATETLSQLKALRVRLHLDDFGTGYSSLSYLHCFPFDGLKIDRSFINHLSVTDGSLDIVRTIVTLASTLRMETIAEGVETVEQLAHLKAIKCQYAQGFLFSKPLDSSAVGPLLESDPQYLADLVDEDSGLL